MKICPECKTQCNDDERFCQNCGASLESAAAAAQSAPAKETPKEEPKKEKAPSQYDHTAEFDASDASDHKLLAMAIYLLGPFGLIIALLGGADSPYTKFHIRQSLKFLVLGSLIGVSGSVLSAVVYVLLKPMQSLAEFIQAATPYYVVSLLITLCNVCIPLITIAALAVLVVLMIIVFINICKGKSIEPPLICKFKILQ